MSQIKPFLKNKNKNSVPFYFPERLKKKTSSGLKWEMKEKDESKMAMTYQTKAIERVKEDGLGCFYGKGELH